MKEPNEKEPNEEDETTGIECPQCGEMTGVIDTCPYAEDIYDDYGECDCCPSCRYECMMDI